MHQCCTVQRSFAHKGTLNEDAEQKNPTTYEHIDPDLVGNSQRVLVSDLAGRSNLLYKAARFGLDLESKQPAVAALLRELKDLEAKGFAFEGAEASFELLMRKAIDGDRLRFYRLIGFRVIDEKRTEGEPPIAEATIMLEGPDGQIEHTASPGCGRRAPRLSRAAPRKPCASTSTTTRPRRSGSRCARPCCRSSARPRTPRARTARGRARGARSRRRGPRWPRWSARRRRRSCSRAARPRRTTWRCAARRRVWAS